jgi:Ca-activated chloride channel homolog
MLQGRITALFVLVASFLSGQEDARLLYEGNKEYYNGRIPQSASLYARSSKLNPNNKKANFNLGASLYRNATMIKDGKMNLPGNAGVKKDSIAGLVYDQAIQNFQVVANTVSHTDTLHQAWHNIGNCYLQKKDFKQAVDAYKKALKYGPKDEQSRYNLAYALKNLPKDSTGSKNQNQPQQQQQDQKKEESRMNKDQAEQLIKAMMESEKRLQDKRKQKPQDASKGNNEKDW